MNTQLNVASAFFDWARRQPEREALQCADARLSYGELAQRALRLASLLEPERDGPHCGVLAVRGPNAFASVLGVLAAGCAYVPLNPSFPAARNRSIAEQAGLRTLLVGPQCLDALRALLATNDAPYRILTLEDEPGLEALLQEFPRRLVWERAPASPARSRPEPVAVDASAYVLFTSGSTGRPKGVVVRHRNVQRYVQNLSSLYPIAPEDRLSQTFELTFDLSVHDMFVAWSNGASLIVYGPRELADPISYTRAQRVSVWFSVPSLATLVDSLRQAEAGALPQLRLSFFCGEKLTWNTWRAWRSLAPRSRVVNLYGPTEATIACTHFEIPHDFPCSASLHGVIPIGRPFPGQRLEILRDDDAPCAPGEPGTLLLQGDQLSAGYLGEPQLTAASFIRRGDALCYRTGDTVLCDAEGRVQFVGRADRQVKIMGYRIELAEIEHALMEVSGAAHAVVDVLPDLGAETLLTAVLPATFASRKRAIRAALAERLPAYMLPRRYVFRSELPRNASGKLDRGALHAELIALSADLEANAR